MFWPPHFENRVAGPVLSDGNFCLSQSASVIGGATAHVLESESTAFYRGCDDDDYDDDSNMEIRLPRRGS